MEMYEVSRGDQNLSDIVHEYFTTDRGLQKVREGTPIEEEVGSPTARSYKKSCIYRR